MDCTAKIKGLKVHSGQDLMSRSKDVAERPGLGVCGDPEVRFRRLGRRWGVVRTLVARCLR